MGMQSSVKVLSGSCNGYVMGDILIDAPAGVSFPGGIKKIILTHEHCDHIAGLGSLASRVESLAGSAQHVPGLAGGSKTTQPAIYASKFTAEIISKKLNRYALCSFLGYEFPNVKVEPLKDGDVLHSTSRGSSRQSARYSRGDAGVSLQVIETPGHSKGAICLYDEERKIFFSGDTVFPDYSLPRTDLPSSEPDKLRATYERLAELEIRTIYPGHGEKIDEVGYLQKLMRLL